jgi:hypothetical protein
VATSTASTALLQGQQLLGTEGLVVDLAGSLDQILKVGAGQEVAQVDKFTVVFVLDVDDTPAVLAAANLLAVDNNSLLTTDNRERNDVLESGVNIRSKLIHQCQAYLDLGVNSPLLIIELVIIIRVHLQVVEGELLLDTLLESLALLQGEGVGLRDNGNDVDDIGQFLENNNIDGLEAI